MPHRISAAVVLGVFRVLIWHDFRKRIPPKLLYRRLDGDQRIGKRRQRGRDKRSRSPGISLLHEYTSRLPVWPVVVDFALEEGFAS